MRITIKGFRHHTTKLQKVVSHIPQAEMALIKGAFQSPGFQASAFQVDVLADLEVRMTSPWTDWNEVLGKWRLEVAADPELLDRNIEAVKKRVDQKRKEWS